MLECIMLRQRKRSGNSRARLGEAICKWLGGGDVRLHSSCKWHCWLAAWYATALAARRRSIYCLNSSILWRANILANLRHGYFNMLFIGVDINRR